MSSFRETGTILDRILAQTASDVEVRKQEKSLSALRAKIGTRTATVSLAGVLAQPGISIIAEFKRASPSKGRFSFEAEPDEVAAEYFAGGAAAMSVLTDDPFFQGSLQDMEAAAGVAHRLKPIHPILRKDFIVDEFQLFEAVAYGADAVLLIVAALSQPKLERFVMAARTYNLEALVEVHDEREMHRAGLAGAQIIGINNRDLRTFEVDLATTERLARRAPKGATIVAESGISTPEDVRRMADAGAHAVLVGESLITAPDRTAAVRALARALATE